MTVKKRELLKKVASHQFIHTKAEACRIRGFRVKGECTWRMVAANAAELWPEKGIASGNQIDGTQLCGEAAVFFNEHAGDPPWN